MKLLIINFLQKEYSKNINKATKYAFLSFSIKLSIPLYIKYINNIQATTPSTLIIYT